MRQIRLPRPQCLYVFVFVIGYPVFPATIDDSNPPIGEGTDRGMMALPFSPFPIVITTGPVAV